MQTQSSSIGRSSPVVSPSSRNIERQHTVPLPPPPAIPTRPALSSHSSSSTLISPTTPISSLSSLKSHQKQQTFEYARDELIESQRGSFLYDEPYFSSEALLPTGK